MLVLTRRDGDSVRIGNVVVKVLEIRKGKVRIGVEAPEDVDIVRGELEERWELTDQAVEIGNPMESVA